MRDGQSPSRISSTGGRLMKSMLMFTAMLICAGQICYAQKSLTVPQISDSPKLDGALDEPVWQQALALGAFTIVGQTNKTDATEFLVMMDNTWLYFGFRCKNKMMWALEPVATHENQAVARDDSVEIIFDPGTDGALFYQFMLSFNNVRATRQWVQWRRDATWTMPWRSATRRDNDGWTAEVALPLSLVKNHGDRAKIRLNVARVERQLELDALGAPLRDARIPSSWGAVKKSFTEGGRHRLSGFENMQIEEPFLASFLKAEVDGYQKTDSGLGYAVKAMVRSHTGKGGNIMFQAEDQPASGETSAAQKIFSIAPLQDVEISLTVPMKEFAQRNVSIKLRDETTNELIGQMQFVKPAILNLIDDLFADKNYYTTENEARLRMRLGLPESELQALTLVARMSGRKPEELARVGRLQRACELTLPLKDMPTGKHAIRIALEDTERKTVFEDTIILTKLAPKPGCEVKVDRLKGVLEKNGKAIFPFGFVQENISRAALENLAQTDHTDIMRWNSRWDYEGATNLAQFMAVAEACGLDVIDYTDTVLDEHLPKKNNPTSIVPRNPAHQQELMEIFAQSMVTGRPALEQHIRDIMDYPNLIGYFCGHEPNLLNVEVKMAKARLEYEVAHQTDPYRPVLAVFSASIPEGGLDVGDIISYDIYLKAGNGRYGIRGYPNSVTYFLKKLRQQTDPARKVAMMVLKTHGQWPLICPRLIMSEEQRCQTYLALIHGSKVIFYFIDSALFTQQMWDTLADLARQVKTTLAPALLSGEVHPAVRHTPVEMDIDKEVFPDVQATLFKNPAGGYILVAANSAYHPVDARFIVPGLDAKTDIKRLFADKTIKAEGETFQDAIEPLGTRAYALVLTPDATKPVALAIETISHPDQALKLKWYDPEKDFAGRRNFVANPSFEITSPPHILPDHVRFNAPTPKYLDLPDAKTAMATDNPVHGKYCMRETIVLPCAPRRRGICGVAYMPLVDTPTPFVLSAYVKASENVKMAYFYLGGKCMTFKEGRPGYPNLAYFTPTTEWQRVVMHGVFDPAKGDWQDIADRRGSLQGVQYYIGPGQWGRFDPWRETGTGSSKSNWQERANEEGVAEFWIDAVQLEFGKEATEFTVE